MKIASSQYNYAYGDQIHYPYSIATLAAYADTQIPWIEWLPTCVLRSKFDEHVERCATADVLLCSCYVWNWEITTALARRVKAINPECHVIFGGPQVPDVWPEQNWVYDIEISVHGEGEKLLVAALQDFMCVEWRAQRIENLADLPSPYTSGMMDRLAEDIGDLKWIATWETNRGCPYQCSFCDWGSATYTKLRQFPIERLMEEADWFVERRIPYIDNADANFGILSRDATIASYLADAVTHAGARMTYRQSWAKNTTSRVIDIGRTLQDAGLLTAVGLAVETLDAPTLQAVKRKNLPFQQFSDLTKQFADAGLPTYTELIRGLPGQTLEAFKSDLALLIDNADIGQIMVYNCSVLVNAPMADPAYMKQYGIKTVRAPIFLRHSDAIRKDIVEYEDIVYETATMSRSDIERAYAYTWIVQLGESLGLCDQLTMKPRMQWYELLLEWCATHPCTVLGAEYSRMQRYVKRGYAGEGWDEHDHALGPILWSIEEASWLRLMRVRSLLEADLVAFTSRQTDVAAQLDSLEWCPHGRDYFDWAREVLWYGRRQQKFRKQGVRVAA